MLKTLLITVCALLSLGCGETSGGALSPSEIIFSDLVLNIAHGGGQGERPDHTMEAYQHAIDAGAHILELDIHATSDGVIVIMHDDTIDRKTNGSGLIKEMTFEDLRSYDAGYTFTEDGGETYPYRGMGLKVPSLREVFEAFPGVPYVIEIKQGSPSIVDSFVELCREYGVVEQTIGAAFSNEVLAELRAAEPDMPTSMSVIEVIEFIGVRPENEATWNPPGKFLQVPPVFQGIEVLNPEFFARAKRLGLKIHVWTINDPGEMQSLIDQGADGIMTDFPTRMTEVLE